MSDDTTVNDSAEDVPAEPTEQPAETHEGEDALGDKGKLALDRMKAERNEARTRNRETAKALDDMRAELERLKSGEQESETERKVREAEAAAVTRANERILRAELRAAAAGKLADPADALKFLDLSAFEVNADGEVDADALAESITDLVEKKPYLAAQGTKRFQGSADGGARPSQPKRAASLAEAVAAKYAESA